MTSLAFLLTGRVQSTLDSAGVDAARIGRLWNIFLIVSAVVFALVMLALVTALLRRGRGTETEGSRGATIAVSVATGITVVILFGLLAASILTGRASASVGKQALEIEVTGRQWWWQVDYDDPDVSRRFTSANELTIPAGVPVKIVLHSPDVIHSFWVPSLQGKRDLIPGHDGSIVLQAERPGVFRGQCAEFCGQQHAKMAFWVTALAPADYARWAEAQRAPAPPPSTAGQHAGQEIFMRSPCPLCHNIQGTDASGKTGPDLTHFAGRRSIAAATLPNRRPLLAAWIVDPQHIKPGNAMPMMDIRPGELEPLLDYLESLK
jgi:cytochrome c oxidase subunit II